MNLSESTIEALRGRRGLDENDNSQDNEILKMDPRKIVSEVCEWELGGSGWDKFFARIMFEAEVTAKDILDY